MTSTTAALIIKNGINKLDSKDYPNVELWKMEQAVNTEAVRFCRRRIDAKESNSKLVNDLQVLLKPAKLAGSNKGTYFLSHKLPSDYFGDSRVTPICSKAPCSGVRIPSKLMENSNEDELLSDYSSQPSFDFEQTFHIIAGNKIKQFHNGDFEVEELEIEYYRRPQYITFPGTPQENGGIGKDMTWEFKDDICDQIIEGAIGILAYNTENINRGQVSDKNLQQTK